MMKFIRRLISAALIVFLLAISVLVFQLLRFQHGELDLPESQTTFLIIPGSNIKSIAEDLTRRKIIDDPWLFILLAKLKNVETRVRAGEYLIEPGQTPEDLLTTFTEGKSIQYSLTVIEGWTFRQMLEAIAADPIIQHSLEGKSNDEIMSLIGQPGKHPEGMFFPDTYRFPKGTTDVEFLRRAYMLMQQHLEREWAARDNDLPLNSSYEALILASIVEKETGAAFERPLIAGVFTERLRRNMRLQTDPTIIYGLGEGFDGDIRFRDLKKDTPYNTYLHAGLTPTPIALPGLDSIRAVLHPAKTDALYFVSKGDGTHQFSATLEEHETAVQHYQLNNSK